MLPTLTSGDYLILRRTRKFRPGQVVLLEDEKFRQVVKRLGTKSDSGWQVLGDNANQSIDSRDYGAVSEDQIKAVVVARYWPWPKLIKARI